MKKLFSKKGITVIVIALIIAAITGVSITVNKDPGLLTNSVNTMLAPIKSVTASVARVCEKIYGYMHDFDRLTEENARLRAQLAGGLHRVGHLPSPLLLKRLDEPRDAHGRLLQLLHPGGVRAAHEAFAARAKGCSGHHRHVLGV